MQEMNNSGENSSVRRQNLVQKIPCYLEISSRENEILSNQNKGFGDLKPSMLTQDL